MTTMYASVCDVADAEREFAAAIDRVKRQEEEVRAVEMHRITSPYVDQGTSEAAWWSYKAAYSSEELARAHDHLKVVRERFEHVRDMEYAGRTRPKQKRVHWVDSSKDNPVVVDDDSDGRGRDLDHARRRWRRVEATIRGPRG